MPNVQLICRICRRTRPGMQGRGTVWLHGTEVVNTGTSLVGLATVPAAAPWLRRFDASG